MGGALKSLSRVLRVLKFVLIPGILRRYIIGAHNVDANVNNLITFATHPKVNRFALAWAFTYTPQNKTLNDRIMVTLLVGLVNGIDNTIDSPEFQLPDTEESFRTILNKSLLTGNDGQVYKIGGREITLQEFKEQLFKFTEEKRKIRINDFLHEMVRTELSFRQTYGAELDQKGYVSFNVAQKYREDTTIAYTRLVLNLTDCEESRIEKSLDGARIVQYLDDYTDAEDDLKQKQPNLFVALLHQNDEFEHYLSGKDFHKTYAQYKDIIENFHSQYSLFPRLFLGWLIKSTLKRN